MEAEEYVVKAEGTPDLKEIRSPSGPKKTRDFTRLKTLPAPLELLVIATRYVNAAHRLNSIIAAGYRPKVENSSEQDRNSATEADGTATSRTSQSGSIYADFVSVYRRYMMGALISCEEAVRLGGPDVRQNLRARLMLAELLARETHNTERTEQVIARALAMASTHESLAEYRFQFLYLQIELSLSNGNVKFAKTLARRATVEVHRDYPSQIGWLYRFQLLFIHILQKYERDYTSASAMIGDMVQQAHSHGHRQLGWTLLIMRARLAMLTGDSDLATTIISGLAKDFNLPIADAEVKEDDTKPKTYDMIHSDPALRDLPLSLLLQFLVLLCIYQTHAGQTTAARQNIRRAQFLLDHKTPAEHENDGCVTIILPCTVGNGGQTQRITLKALPRSVFYAYTFLISTIVQLDPVGRHPKCLYFASAGLERLIEMFDFGWDFRSPEVVEDSRYVQGSVGTVEEHVKQVAGIRLDLMLIQGDLLLMRSSLNDVHAIIADLVNLARSYDLWDMYKPRIVTLHAMFCAFLGELDTAFEYFTRVLEWTGATSHLGIVARASLLLIRLAQGHRVRLTTSDGHTSRSSLKGRQPANSDAPADTDAVRVDGFEYNEDLEGFAKRILIDCNKLNPSLKILGLIVEALVNGEISRAKRNLSLALQMCSDVGNQHIKPVVLALLACQFSNTRNDQAFKMLHSAHAIAASMGGADRNKDKIKLERKDGSPTPENAGLARLGLWTGKHLLEIYQVDNLTSKVARQQEQNSRYERALYSQSELARLALQPG